MKKLNKNFTQKLIHSITRYAVHTPTCVLTSLLFPFPPSPFRRTAWGARLFSEHGYGVIAKNVGDGDTRRVANVDNNPAGHNTLIVRQVTEHLGRGRRRGGAKGAGRIGVEVEVEGRCQGYALFQNHDRLTVARYHPHAVIHPSFLVHQASPTSAASAWGTNEEKTYSQLPNEVGTTTWATPPGKATATTSTSSTAESSNGSSNAWSGFYFGRPCIDLDGGEVYGSKRDDGWCVRDPH